jgi:hypothetical protein
VGSALGPSLLLPVLVIVAVVIKFDSPARFSSSGAGRAERPFVPHLQVSPMVVAARAGAHYSARRLEDHASGMFWAASSTSSSAHQCPCRRYAIEWAATKCRIMEFYTPDQRAIIRCDRVHRTQPSCFATSSLLDRERSDDVYRREDGGKIRLLRTLQSRNRA